MARETVAARNARLEAERLAAEVEARAAYPDRMMLALDRATNSFDFELLVRNGDFVLKNRDAEYSWEAEFILSREWDRDSELALSNLEDELDSKAAARAEAVRRENVRKAALSKLSDEERELLGL